MKYKEIQKYLTDTKIPQVWEEAVATEKTAEILVYTIMAQCMERFSDVAIELSADDPVGAVLRSWTHDEDIGFGTNAIYLEQKVDGTLILGCTYNIWKLRDDVEIMATNMFGTLNLNNVGDAVIDADTELPDNKISTLLAGIQKKKVPIRNKE